MLYLSERELRLIENCKNYAASDPAGLPGHNLALIIAKLSSLLDDLAKIGEIQSKLESVREHLDHATGIKELIGEFPSESEQYARLSYTIDRINSAHDYLSQAIQIGYRAFGEMEGQLCPYDDCSHDLAIEVEGWCICGHCKRPFYAQVSDSDTEDYHCREPEQAENVPQALLYCRDLGPSWATPKDTDNE